MERNIDKRGVLDEEIFSYRISKDGTVFISWHSKQVKIIRGDKAQDFIRAIQDQTGKEAQLIMAKETGNFKRGNERQRKR